jgi:DNA repair exonuclease SbcCD nuclease subunit
MKIALITDTHFGARNDSQIFTDHFMKFYDKVFFPYLEENDIKTLIHLGDLVDRRKYINYVTLNTVRRDFIFKLGDMGIDTHIIIGNHDTYYKNTNKINAVQELFTTLEGEQEPWIYEEPIVKNFDGLDILFVPWICPENAEKTMEMLNTTTAQVLMGHLEVTGYSMYRGLVCDHGLNKKTFNKFDMVLSGHFHYKNGDGHIQYLGTPYELMWSDVDDPKGFYVFDTDTRDMNFIVNPYKIFHKIFYNDLENEYLHRDYDEYENSYVKVIVVEKEDSYKFDLFLDRLYSFNPHDVTIIEDPLEILDTAGELDEAEDTMTILSKYIDGLELTVDKTRLDSLMKTLYLEAVEIE